MDSKVSHSRDLLILENRTDADNFPNLIVGKPKEKPYDKLKTFKPTDNSVFSKIKTFLPKMEKADRELKEALQASSADSMNIENMDGWKGPLIEMNLALVEYSGESESENSNNDDFTLDSNASDESDNVSSQESDGDEEKTHFQARKKKSLIEEVS